MRSNLLILAISCALALLAGEWAVAKLRPNSKTYPEILSVRRTPQPLSRSDYLPFTLPPNLEFIHRTEEFNVVYRTNDFGYRGPDPAFTTKANGVTRILVLGDSFTLGWANALEDTFVEMLRIGLLAQGGGPVEVINAGYHAGYSPDSYLAYMRREGGKLGPDLVLVVLYPDNDLMDIQENVWLETEQDGTPTRVGTVRNYTDFEGSFIKDGDGHLPWHYRLPLLNRSHLFVAAGNVMARTFSKFTAAEPTQPPSDFTYTRFKLAIKALMHLAQQFNFDLKFVILPALDTDAIPAKQSLYSQTLKQLRDLGPVPQLDLVRSLTPAHYFPIDKHLNPSGNRAVADALLEFVSRRRSQAVE